MKRPGRVRRQRSCDSDEILGWLILSGRIDGRGITIDGYRCELTVDGGTVAGTIRRSVVKLADRSVV